MSAVVSTTVESTASTASDAIRFGGIAEIVGGELELRVGFRTRLSIRLNLINADRKALRMRIMSYGSAKGLAGLSLMHVPSYIPFTVDFSSASPGSCPRYSHLDYQRLRPSSNTGAVPGLSLPFTFILCFTADFTLHKQKT
jgi:hypothetical protein